MKSLWNHFSGIGVLPSLNFPLQQRIRLSNQISLVMGVTAFGFLINNIFSYSYLSVGSMLTLVLISTLIPLFNHYSWHPVSRFIVCLAPPIATLAQNVLIKVISPEKIGFAHYISPRLILIAYAIIPLIMFTIRERIPMIVSLAITIFLGTIGYEYTHRLFGVHYDELAIELLRYDVIYEDIFLLLLVILFGLFFFIYLNAQYENRTQRLLAEAQEKNRQLNQREAHLERTLTELRKSREEDKKRNWETKGLARFTNLMRSKAEKDTLYRILLSGIVKYVEAHMGGFYLIQENEEGSSQIELVSCYAFSRKKYEKKSFERGEGLIGQVVVNQKTLILKDLPPDFFKIDIGLGQAFPRTLLIIPLSFHGQTEGVLELAFIREPEPFKVQFLEKLSENIGAIIASNLAKRPPVTPRPKPSLDQPEIAASEIEKTLIKP